MKMTKRIFALLVCAVMLATSCIFVNAGKEDKATINLGNTVNINEDVSYTNLTLVSGQNGNTVTGVSMEFDPADGYFPMAFVKNAGSVGLLNRQYDSATTKYGYDVIGAINGSFFGMDSGTLVGLLITNGKVSCAHAGYTDSVVAFGTDGSMNIVKSSLDYKLFINGQEIKNGLYYINKTHGKNGGWTNNFYYYDTSCGTITDTYDTNPGYTVICEKLDNTDLMVGSTLKGKVLEVRENSSYVRFEENDNVVSNKFALFVKTSSPNAQYVKDLKAGDSINISVNETVAASREIIEKANSVITNVGWLVKDGVDRTRIDSTIGTHSVTLEARWTAFGTKPDGSYVFFTTEGASTGSSGSVTLRDVADYMISQGCTNVIRMDGGGSSAMYVKDTGNGNPGFVQSSSRAIADCILIVKKSSAVDEDLNAALQAKIDEAKTASNEAIAGLVAEAEALLASDAPVSGDVRKMLADLSGALSGKDELADLVAQATGISYKDYSEVVLTKLRAAYDNAVAVLGAEDSTIEQVEEAAAELKSLLALSGEATLVVSTGKDYTTTAPNRHDSWDDDQIRLTDGSKGNADAGTSKYAGWNSNDKSKPNVVEVTIDLGEATATNQYTAYMAGGNWGINLPKGFVSLKVYASNDNENFDLVATASEEDMILTGGTESNESWSTYTITANGKKAVTARYIKISVIHAVYGNAFIWMDEVEAGITGTPVTDAIYVNGFNTSITSGMCYIFTPAISADGTVSRENANHSWTTNVVLEKTDVEGEYVVIKKFKGNGASTPSVKLEANQIMIAAHNWEETVPGSQANEALLGTAKVGDTLKFYGLNIEKAAAGIGAYVKIVVPEEPEYILGDVNGKDGIEKYDYIAVKRAVMGTLTLDETQQKAADVNKKDGVEKYDYILIKRHVMGTFKIEG
ncbi:MAG: phosphodiester glycosidase family protein [Clostridia bacterium]|nr:phosphodiester glycosidase family protein [Clostridia bacterium]